MKPLGTGFRHGLPVGIRDLGPADAAALRGLELRLTETFEDGGYRRVITPTFELAHVFERGLGPDGAARLMRFVDPQNGEILALRSDITPQIARLICGPMADEPLPVRLSYFGRVFRLRQHSEFQQREVTQAGAELIGDDTVTADIEILSLCDRALTAAGELNHVLSIGHVGLATAALNGLADDALIEAIRLLRRKDASGLKVLLEARGAAPTRSRVVVELAQLYGTPSEVMPAARALATRLPELNAPLDRLQAILRGLDRIISGRVLIDCSEMLGFGYYTGLVFGAFVPGVGQAVASGGRYDDLLARYGRALPACGFAVDEEGLTVAVASKALESGE